MMEHTTFTNIGRRNNIGKCIDLTGQKFGKLTVLYKNSKRFPCGRLTTYWHCKCECGNECDKSSQQLRSVKYISCGKCSPQKIRKNYKDIAGMKFGRLLVLEIDTERRNIDFEKQLNSGIRLYWKCQCDCGNKITVRGDLLRSGRVLSCGCYQKEIATYVTQKLNWKTNEIIELEDSILIESSNGDDYSRIDKEDYRKVKDYCWCSSHGYAVAPIRGEKNKFARMHRIIMDCGENEDDLVVDHINHDITDNRKRNLRIATNAQNNWNSINSHNSGIKYNSNKNTWKVSINYNLQNINLGEFNSYDEAQEIRNKAEQIFYGEFQYGGNK